MAAAAAVASPSALPLRPSLRGLHSSPLWRAMRNVTGNTAAPHSQRNAPPRPSMAATPTPTPQFAHAQPGAPQLSRTPPPPPTGGRGAALHPAFAAPGSSRLGRVLRVLFLIWVANLAWTVHKLQPPEMSEEQQRRLQLERAQKRAARWRSPQDDLFIRHNLDDISKLFDELQRTLAARHAALQVPVPFHYLMTVAALEAGLKARMVAQFNRVIEARPLPPGASEPKENEWSE